LKSEKIVFNRYGFNSPPLAAMKLGYDAEAGNFQLIPRPLAAGLFIFKKKQT
jgi:hypothetical protein